MLKNKERKIIYFLIIFIPALFIVFKISNNTDFKFKVVGLVSRPAALLSFPVFEIKKLVYYHRTFEEYKKLKKESDNLRSRLIGLEEVLLENSRLEKLLNFKRSFVYSSVPAKVIWRNPSNWNSTIIIDKGEKDGIKLGMPVVSASGVVGKIAELEANRSKIILLTDPNFSVAAMISGVRESGLVSGSLQGLCRMKYIDLSANVKVGDKVITSKLSHSFPESLLVGEVIRIYDDPKTSSVECLIAPAVSFSQIEEVLVILKEQ